jgi:hypothetical protein
MYVIGQFCVDVSIQCPFFFSFQVSSSSSPASSDSEHNYFSLLKYIGKTRSPEMMELSSDSESSPITVKKSRKEKKHKHRISDLEGVHVVHDGHNGKHHRHRCHHHSHHRHGHSNRVKEGRMHKRTCPKHKMSLKAVEVKKEPMDEDNGRIGQPHSSQRRLKRRRAASDDGHDDQVVR